MFSNNNKPNLRRKTLVLSYVLSDYSKAKLAEDLNEKMKRNLSTLWICEYSPKIVTDDKISDKEYKYLVYLSLKSNTYFSRSDSFEIAGVKPSLKNYTLNDALTKIKEKDPDCYQQGEDITCKLKAIKDKKNSVYAENIYKLKNGQITCKQIREKNPVDWSNNKRKYREFEEEEYVIRKKRRIERGEMLPSKFKMIPMTVIKDNRRSDLKEILKWYNFRLVEQRWNKNAAGLYIWSLPKSVGKTLLLKMLKKIDPDIFEWDKNDGGYQSKWDKIKDYSMVVFNAINDSGHVPYNVFEELGDEDITITMKKKYDAAPDYISSKTPWILTSNKPSRLLYFRKDTEILTERCIEVELKGDLFELINIIADYNGVERSKPNDAYVLSKEYYQDDDDITNTPLKKKKVEQVQPIQMMMKRNPKNSNNIPSKELEPYIYMEEDDPDYYYHDDTLVNFTPIWDLDYSNDDEEE